MANRTILGFAYKEGGDIYLHPIRYDRPISIIRITEKGYTVSKIKDLYHDGNKIYSFMLSRPRLEWFETDSIEDLGVFFALENEETSNHFNWNEFVGGGWVHDQRPDSTHRMAFAITSDSINWRVMVCTIESLNSFEEFVRFISQSQKLVVGDIILPILQTKRCETAENGVYWVG